MYDLRTYYKPVHNFIRMTSATEDFSKSGGKMRTTPAHLAILAKNDDILRWILKNNTSPNLRDKARMPLLHFAIWSRNFEAMRILVDYGADVNVRDRNRNSLLLAAVVYGDHEHVKYLVEKGAKFTWWELLWKTPMKISTKARTTEIDHIIKSIGHRRNSHGSGWKSATHKR